MEYNLDDEDYEELYKFFEDRINKEIKYIENKSKKTMGYILETEEELYEFLEDCIDGKIKIRYSEDKSRRVKNLKINVLKFQSNFSSLLTFKTEMVGIMFTGAKSTDGSTGCFTIRTNHKDSNKQYIYSIWYNRNTKIFNLKSDYSSFQTFVYTDTYKDDVLYTINKIRLASIEDLLKKVTKIQTNFNRVLTNAKLKQ